MSKDKCFILFLTVLFVSTNSFPAVINPIPDPASQDNAEEQSFWQKWTVPGILAGTCVILIATLAFSNVQLNRRLSGQAEKFEGQVAEMKAHSHAMKRHSENMKRSIQHHRGLTGVLKVISRRMIDNFKLGKHHRGADALMEAHDGGHAGDVLVAKDDIGNVQVGGRANLTVDGVLATIDVEDGLEDGGPDGVGLDAVSPTLEALGAVDSMTVGDVTPVSVSFVSADGDARELVVPEGGFRFDEEGRLIMPKADELNRV